MKDCGDMNQGAPKGPYVLSLFIWNTQNKNVLMVRAYFVVSLDVGWGCEGLCAVDADGNLVSLGIMKMF